MAEEPSYSDLGPELAAAVELGFFTRHFDETALDAIKTLSPYIAESIQRRLQEAVSAVSIVAQPSQSERESLATLADRALSSQAPCRPLYELGSALGEYHQRRLAHSPAVDFGPLWNCVRRMSPDLTRMSACLHDLAEQANGPQDLNVVLTRVNAPWTDRLCTDDEDEYRAAYRVLFDVSPPWVQRALTGSTYSPVIGLVLQVTHELRDDVRRVATVKATRDAKGSPKARPLTPLQQAILKALDGRALKKEKLAAECKVEGTRLYRRGGIKELMRLERVANKHGVGYYRTDAPPPESIVDDAE